MYGEVPYSMWTAGSRRRDSKLANEKCLWLGCEGLSSSQVRSWTQGWETRTDWLCSLCLVVLVEVEWQRTWLPNPHPACPASKYYRSWKNEWEQDRKCHWLCQQLQRAGLAGWHWQPFLSLLQPQLLCAACRQLSGISFDLHSSLLGIWKQHRMQKREMPVFVLLHSVSFCLWWFCCLTWYKSWLEYFLLCTLNLVFHSSCYKELHMALLKSACAGSWSAIYTKVSTG